MKKLTTLNRVQSGCNRRSGFMMNLAASGLLAALTACGGGGGGAPVPEAVVQSVANAQVLEGGTGTSLLEFIVTLNKPAVAGVTLTFSTASTSKAGIASTGSAIGGGICSNPTVEAATDVDFVTVSGSAGVVTIAAGATTGKLRVTVCGDSFFEPTETLQINWSSSGQSGVAVGTIVNDDAGGLNGTGATTGMGGLAAFGRDVNPLTNTDSDSDGVLGFSFDKTNPACTLDKVTGLSWERTVTTGQSYANLQAIVNAANTANVCNKSSGWRVPTVNELLTLVNANVVFPDPVNADAMTTVAEVMTGGFWSSESLVNSLDNAWVMSAANGGAVSYENIATSQNVRLVNGAPTLSACNDSARYNNDFGDGTVEDKKTSLMWKQCAEGGSGSQCGAGLTGFNTSADIVSRVNEVNASSSLGLGYADWRIPTVKELASLVDRCATSGPAINSFIFPNNQSISYISATYDANSSEPQRRYWYVEFGQGAISVASPSSKYLRLVRAGQ